jgi:molecular chaperone DnaK (HSP70)
MIIGIDLGTSNICCSYYKNNKIHFIHPQNPFIPALVYIGDTCHIGFDAIPYKYSNNCYHSLKRLLNNKELYILLLKYIKQLCDIELNVYDVIITIPVYFNDLQRKFTIECIQFVGFNCIRMINEPVSACIAYGLNNNDQTIMVLDIGGGTTDISFVKNEDNIIDVIYSHGNPSLGGNDITNKLLDFILKKNKINNSNNMLFHKIDEIKIKLSEIENYNEKIVIDNIEININISRNDLINICNDIWKNIEYLIMEGLNNSKLSQDNINYIILVGGSTKIPYIKTIIKKIFHYNKLLDTINPDTIVSEGASILGASINNTLNKELLLLDISQFQYSLEDDDNNMIIMIERNMPLPCKISKKFTTTHDYTNKIEVKVFQDKILLGKLFLMDFEKDKKGVPVINITFELNVSSILSVYIEDKKTGKNIKHKFC